MSRTGSASLLMRTVMFFIALQSYANCQGTGSASVMLYAAPDVIWNNVNGDHVLFRAGDRGMTIIRCRDLIRCRLSGSG